VFVGFDFVPQVFVLMGGLVRAVLVGMRWFAACVVMVVIVLMFVLVGVGVGVRMVVRTDPRMRVFMLVLVTVLVLMLVGVLVIAVHEMPPWRCLEGADGVFFKYIPGAGLRQAPWCDFLPCACFVPPLGAVEPL